VQSRLVLRVQIDACRGQGMRVSDLAERGDDMGGRVPSMMSISPPAGHGPCWLRVQKAGQVAQPAGMCAKSRTNIASSYAVCEEMRTLSRPRADGSTMDQSSARMTNLSPVAKKKVDRREPNQRASGKKKLGNSGTRGDLKKRKTHRTSDCSFLRHQGSRS